MTGSGKTVLVTTLAVKMAQMTLKDIYMGPAGANRRQTLKYTQDNWESLKNGQWPPSTPAGELIELQWELSTKNCQATVQFLDCAGQDIRSLFSTDNFNPNSLGEDLRRVFESVNSANVLIFLVNMKDLLATRDMTSEVLDLDQMLHTLQLRNDIPRRIAVAFSQYDKYKPEVDEMFNGDFLEYVRHYLPYLYGQYNSTHNFELIPVAAVNETREVIENGVVKQYPAPNFSSYNLEKLIRWIADSVEEVEPLIPKTAAPVANVLTPGSRQVFNFNGVEFAFRWCPPGIFVMGGSEYEFGSLPSEKLHQVVLNNGFWMMETQVTQKQWQVVMGYNPSLIVGDNLPVNNVTWFDCQDFCMKCTQLGLPIQLPTESQWEYACRVGYPGPFAGNLDAMAWYSANSGGKPRSVGMKQPNAWGLYDMHGNVEEWCFDWYNEYPDGIVVDYAGPYEGSFRVLRGGSWNVPAEDCRSACRGCQEPGFASNEVGFRCVNRP